jgi:hypothetical protein
MFSLSTGKVLSTKFSPNKWNTSLSLPQGKPTFFTFAIPMDHVGSMLGVHARYQGGVAGEILICLQKDFGPTFYKRNYNDNYGSMNCSGQISSISQYSRISSIYVPFPGTGKWYVSLYAPSNGPYHTDNIVFYAEIQACSNDCNGHGACEIHTKADIVYGLCSCDAGYKGWSCDEDKDVDLAQVLLLTLSSLVFLVDAVIAMRKKMYPETLVYLFLLIMSTVSIDY